MMLLPVALLLASSASIPPGDPYPALHGGKFVGSRVAASPDPVQNYVWDLDALAAPDAYQVVADRPVAATLTSGATSDWEGVATLASASGKAAVTVRGPGVVRLKFAQEGACWVEFESADLAASDATVSLTISENNLPAPLETHAPVQHNATWRLEPNSQLYEGVRYAFLNVSYPTGGAAAAQQRTPFHISSFRRACQVVPTNYVGHFESSDADLDRIWWVGAYTVRVTLCGVGIGGGRKEEKAAGRTTSNDPPGVFLGSELMDRGDRIAFLGDAHVAQATALSAFGNYKVLAQSATYTKSIANTIEPYWVMWVLSCMDYWDATADVAALTLLRPWIVKRLEHALVLAAAAATPTGAALAWSRDDDRMGFGFEFCDKPEAQRAFRALTLEACARFGAVEASQGNATAAARYGGAAKSIAASIRGEGSGDPATPWYAGWGMHATADAINAGFMSEAEIKGAVALSLSDPLQLPSLSNFDSFFVLRALRRANASALAMGLVRRHWSYVTKLNATTTWERFDPQHLDSGAMSVDAPPVNVMNDRTSMAHPWSSGATPYLSAAGLGIAPTLAGYARWDALPQLMGEVSDASRLGLLRAVRGKVPTPHGAIAIAMDLDAGTCVVTVPANTVGRVGVPKLSGGLLTVDLVAAPGLSRSGGAGAPPLRLLANASDARAAEAEASGADTAGAAASLNLDSSEDDRFWLLGGLQEAGEYVLHFTHAAATSAKHDADGGGELDVRTTTATSTFHYAAELLGIDTTTKGDWVGRYGSTGYAIFNASSEATDLVKLPAWASAVWAPTLEMTSDPVPMGGAPPNGNARTKCPRPFHPDADAAAPSSGTLGKTSGHKLCVWVWNASLSSDPRTPQRPPGAAGAAASRRVQASAVASYSWGGSFHLDVQAKDPTAAAAHNITLYVVDYQKWGATQVIKAMDLTTLQTIAPMAFVKPDAFIGGAYITYRYTGGMRFRLEQVHAAASDRAGFPPRSMVSAVYFD